MRRHLWTTPKHIQSYHIVLGHEEAAEEEGTAGIGGFPSTKLYNIKNVVVVVVDGRMR